ncbi:MAG: AbrB/MazE/SpoVT family DNA-binding domain-containing protein [Gemmatimonadota bacterium]
MQARISKWGNSLAVRIPRTMLSDLGLVEGDSMEILVENGRLMITPVPREYRLDELVEGITAENQHSETDWGPPQGAESW